MADQHDDVQEQQQAQEPAEQESAGQERRYGPSRFTLAQCQQPERPRLVRDLAKHLAETLTGGSRNLSAGSDDEGYSEAVPDEEVHEEAHDGAPPENNNETPDQEPA